MYAVTQSAELFTENKIITNKQNTARSGVEQPADLTPVFRIIKKIQPTHMVRDIPVDRCPMKRLISDMFHSENMSFLSLKSTKKNALIDFLSVLPDIATRACSKDKRNKLGCFEHLTQIIGAGFDPASEPAMEVIKNYNEGGLLIMSKDDERQIKLYPKKELTAVQKFQEVIAYLFEFGYDLALSPENNVSRSPGFESILGIFGG